MRAMTWMSAVLMFAVACKKGEEKKAEAPPKTVENQKQEPAPPPVADVPVTSKNPKALEAFEMGRSLTDNARGGEAAVHFKKALHGRIERSFAVFFDVEHLSGSTNQLPNRRDQSCSIPVSLKAGDQPGVGRERFRRATCGPAHRVSRSSGPQKKPLHAAINRSSSALVY